MAYIETHNHSFESVPAASAEPWLREMTQNTFGFSVRAIDEIFGVKKAELAGLDIDETLGEKSIARAQIFLLRTPQPQSQLYKETTALAVGFSRIDHQVKQDDIVRFFISHLSQRKPHADDCMDGFLESIEAEAQTSVNNYELACSGILTVVKGNFYSSTFSDRGYSPDRKDHPELSSAFQRNFTKTA